MKHSEKEKTTLDSLSPKLNRNLIAYHETGDLFADISWNLSKIQ